MMFVRFNYITTTMILVLLLSTIVSSSDAMSSVVKHSNNNKVIAFDLQRQHPLSSPSSILRSLSNVCEDNQIHSFDVYGDFHLGTFHNFVFFLLLKI